MINSKNKKKERNEKTTEKIYEKFDQPVTREGNRLLRSIHRGYNKFIKERGRRRGSFQSVSPFDRQKNGSNELISEQPVEMHPSTFLQPRHVRPGAVDKGDLPGFLGYLEEGGEARVAAAAVNRDPNLSSRGREKRPRVYKGWG